MQYGHINVQVRTSVGKVSTFIRADDGSAISPYCDDLSDLYVWMRANGWKADEYEGETRHPWRVSNVDGDN